jgi:L-amino acid N-acyltransferase YncA
MIDLSYGPISSVPVSDGFFDTLRADSPGFDDWLRRKAAEPAYVARREDGGLDGFLYLKLEDGGVTDVQPALSPARRLNVATFKVTPHGTRFGERLMKKVFDHATEQDGDENHVTVFPKHAKLIELFAQYGFTKVAEKKGATGTEDVMRAWYGKNGFAEGKTLFTSTEEEGKGLDSDELKKTAPAIKGLLE